MEQVKSIAKVRWYLRYKDATMGWSSLMNKSGIRYFDTFEQLANLVAKRVDANPNMRFEFVKEVYYVKALLASLPLEPNLIIY